VESLTRRGLLDQTLIVFFSDHGDMLGDHNLWRKSYAYAGSSRVPFLVRWPEGILTARRGATMDQMVELRDVRPTFLDAVATPAASPGWQKPAPLDRRQHCGLAPVPRSRTRRLLLSRQSLERARRPAL